MRPTNNYMSPEQFSKVLDAIPRLHIRKWPDYDVKMLFLICYWCALRIGEALRLNAESFDLESRKLYLGKTKEYKNDYTWVPSIFIPDLQAWLVAKQGPLFPNLTYNTVIRWIQRLGKELDIEAWTTPQDITGEKTKTHIFRKSIAKDQLTGTYGRKAELPTISQTLRHKGKNPMASTIKYIKADSESVNNFWDEVAISNSLATSDV